MYCIEYTHIYNWFLYCNAEYLERTLMYVVQTYTATTIVLGKLATLTSSHLRKIVSSHISFPDFQPIHSGHSGSYWSTRHAWCRWAMLCQILWAPSQSRPPLMEVPTPMLTRRPRVPQSYRLQCQILEPICKHSKPTRGIGLQQIWCGSLWGNPGGLWDCLWGECSVGKCSTEIARCATKGFRAGLLEVRLWKGDFSLKFFQKEMMLKMRISLFAWDVWLSCIVRLFVACEGAAKWKWMPGIFGVILCKLHFCIGAFIDVPGAKRKAGTERLRTRRWREHSDQIYEIAKHRKNTSFDL